MRLLDKFKQENPAYSDTPEDVLLPAIYNKFYKDSGISSEEFVQKVMTPEKPSEFEANKLQSAVLGAAQAGTLGYADEIAAGVGGLLGGDPQEILRQQRAAIQAAKENPASYLGGEVAGAIAGGIGTGTAKVGANVLSKLGNIKGGAALGGIQGGLYASGTATGDPQARVEAVPYGVGMGAAGGVAGGTLFNAGGKLVRNLTDRAKAVYGKKPQAPQSQQSAPQQEVGLSGQSIQETPSVSVLAQQGEQITMPQGARTGDVNMMRIEEAARQGNLGQEAQQQISAIDRIAQQQVQERTQSLVGQTADESGDILSGGIGKVQDVFAKRKALQNELMTARNDAIARSGVYKDYVKGTLGEQLSALKKTADFEVALPKEANKALLEEFKAFNRIANKKGDVNFTFLQAWRSGLNDLRKGGDQKSVLAGQMARTYDDWLNNITVDAIKAGDHDIADKIIKANKEYAQFKSLYGTDKRKGQNTAIESILNKEDLTPEQAVNTLFGKSVSGNSFTAQNLNRIMDGLPDEMKPIVANEFRGGLVKRAYENATKTGELKLGTLKNELIKLRRSEPYKMTLSDPDADVVIDGLIDDLGKIVSAQSRRDVYSPSAPAVLRGLTSIMDKAGYVMPSARGAASITEGVGRSAASRGDKVKLENSIKELMNQVDTANKQNTITRVYGNIAGGTATGDTPLRVTVYPEGDPRNTGVQ